MEGLKQAYREIVDARMAEERLPDSFEHHKKQIDILEKSGFTPNPVQRVDFGWVNRGAIRTQMDIRSTI